MAKEILTGLDQLTDEEVVEIGELATGILDGDVIDERGLKIAIDNANGHTLQVKDMGGFTNEFRVRYAQLTAPAKSPKTESAEQQ